MTAAELAKELLKTPDAHVVITHGTILLHIAAVSQDDGKSTFIHAWPDPGTFPQ